MDLQSLISSKSIYPNMEIIFLILSLILNITGMILKLAMKTMRKLNIIIMS